MFKIAANVEGMACGMFEEHYDVVSVSSEPYEKKFLFGFGRRG